MVTHAQYPRSLKAKVFPKDISEIDLIVLMIARATALLIFAHVMVVMQLRITSRTLWSEVEMLL